MSLTDGSGLSATDIMALTGNGGIIENKFFETLYEAPVAPETEGGDE